jgi:hypothetical protein
VIESRSSVLEADECSCLDIDKLRGKYSPQPFNYPGTCDGSLRFIKIVRGNGMERSIVKERVADIEASSKRFKEKISDELISQERFMFDMMRIECGSGVYKESGCD